MSDYNKTFSVLWADLDPNFHMRHTAYNDYAAQVRLAFLSEHGFPLRRLKELNLGPVLFSEKTDFLREVGADDILTVTLKAAGVNSDGRKWKMRHEIFKSDGVKAAIVQVDGAWFSTETRKLVVPPTDLKNLFNQLTKTEDFVIF